MYEINDNFLFFILFKEKLKIKLIFATIFGHK